MAQMRVSCSKCHLRTDLFWILAHNLNTSAFAKGLISCSVYQGVKQISHQQIFKLAKITMNSLLGYTLSAKWGKGHLSTGYCMSLF